MDLQTTWFILLFVLLIGYAILDGFDLGVGTLHLLWRDDRSRRISLNSIGPVWDGNEVWLLTGGGALFAAFPDVYAAVFSGFYIALMLLLVALIGRAVAIEFRSKVESARWRNVWDVVFCLGSLLPAVLLGVAFGNILRGVPLTADREFAGTFLSLLNPYAVLIGVLSLSAFTLHGALYLMNKADDAMRAHLTRFLRPLWLAFVVFYIIASVCTFLISPFLIEKFTVSPLMWLLALLVIVTTIAIGPLVELGRFAAAFAASSTAIGSMMALAAASLFPRLVPSRPDLSNSLTIAHSSSPGTLRAMLIIALIGMPFVLAYTAVVYRAFKGKVLLAPDSY